ncbi:hypothetical protein Aph01nite_16940 [Acrocarpospora phusangensis]|uniref:Uncharacterized protein n=1 Tax=Acrocarpospora phusangensis TaxID=1070424 RepID=A0A919Q6M3_9ACTN|nr:hypothetical protein [Acrocarpospora phusangensis]GIH23384.1 hypothetical protein Aph01nite_16940 [Acrocarpospora phusangensis]
MKLIDIARAYAEADNRDVQATTIHLHHYLLACMAVDTRARRMLTESGFTVRELRVPEPPGSGSYRLAPDLNHAIGWARGMRAGLGGEADWSLCFLVGGLAGDGTVDRWLRHRGVDLDALSRRLSEEFGTAASVCGTRPRYSLDPPIRLPKPQAEALMRDLHSRGLKFMMNHHDDGTIVIIPEEERSADAPHDLGARDQQPG